LSVGSEKQQRCSFPPCLSISPLSAQAKSRERLNCPRDRARHIGVALAPSRRINITGLTHSAL
jgi:hypothetical protein